MSIAWHRVSSAPKNPTIAIRIILIGSLGLLSLIPQPIRAKDKPLTAEQLAETSILAYGGRVALALVRRTGIEESKIVLATNQGSVEGALHTRFSRKEKSELDQRRIDLEIPNQILTLSFDGKNFWGAVNGEKITPSVQAEATFRAAGRHNYEALLRYKEDGSTLELNGKKNIVGIECYPLELTHTDGSKTLYYISDKSFRILHLEYQVQLAENKPIAIRQSFYDFRPMQNTLVPAKIVTFENGQISQTTELRALTYGVQIQPEIFEKY